MSSLVNWAPTANGARISASVATIGTFVPRKFLTRPLLFLSWFRETLWCGRAAHHPEADVLRCRRAGGTRIRRTIRASAFGFAFSIGKRDPFGDVSSEVEDQLLILLSLAGESSRGFQQRRSAAKLLHLLPEAVGVVGIWRVTRPIIQGVFAVF